MKDCIYDNPISLHREYWRDGKLIRSYSALLLVIKLGGMDGPQWKANNLEWNPKALPDKLLRFYMEF